MTPFTFSGSTIVSSYVENAMRAVPGLRDLPKMAGALLAERVPADARILVLGAGGGLELKGFAEMQPGWHFDGVDPSAEMLQLAYTTLGPLATRVRLQKGYIDTAPMGPFDGATCLLTLHFLPRAERLETLKQVHMRLKAGAPLVVVHHSFAHRRSGPRQVAPAQRCFRGRLRNAFGAGKEHSGAQGTTTRALAGARR